MSGIANRDLPGSVAARAATATASVAVAHRIVEFERTPLRGSPRTCDHFAVAPIIPATFFRREAIN